MSSDQTNYDVSVTSSDYSKFIVHLWLSRNWVWFAVPVCIAASLAFVSIEAALCVAMVLAVATPMVLALVYYNLILTEYSRYSVVGKRVTFCDDGIKLDFPTKSKIASREIPYQTIREIYTKDNLIAIAINGRSYDFLLLPRENFNQDDIRLLVTKLRNSGQQRIQASE